MSYEYETPESALNLQLSGQLLRAKVEAEQRFMDRLSRPVPFGPPPTTQDSRDLRDLYFENIALKAILKSDFDRLRRIRSNIDSFLAKHAPPEISPPKNESGTSFVDVAKDVAMVLAIPLAVAVTNAAINYLEKRKK